MIDQPTIDRILDAANIVDVVSEFVTLRKRGINYVGLCPFHSDKSPSFYVSPAKPKIGSRAYDKTFCSGDR